MKFKELFRKLPPAAEPAQCLRLLVCSVAPLSVSGGFQGTGVRLCPSSQRWCGFVELRSLFPELHSQGQLPAAGIQGCRERRLYPVKPKSDPDGGGEGRLSLGGGPSSTCTPRGTGWCRALGSVMSHGTKSTGWRGKHGTDVTFQSMHT